MARFTTFSIKKGDKEKLTSLLPNRKQNKILSDFILNHYSLPENINELSDIPEEIETPGFTLSDEAFHHIQKLVDIASEKNKDINMDRSKIMRDILKQLFEWLKYNPLTTEKKKTKSQRFKVSSGTIATLRKYTTDNNRNELLEHFILNDYSPREKDIAADVPGKDSEEDLFVQIDKKAFDLLDQYKSKTGAKSRTTVMRDVLKQLITSLDDGAPGQKNEKDLYSVMDKYKSKYGEDTLKEKVEDYFKK